MMAATRAGRDPVFTFGFIFFGVVILAILAPLVPLGLAPAVAVAAIGLIAVAGMRRRWPRPDWALTLMLVLFLAWAGISLNWTIGGSKAVNAWMGLLCIWLSGLCLPSLIVEISQTDARRAARWLSLAACVGLLLLTIELLFNQPIQHLAATADKHIEDYERDINRAALLTALMAGPVSLLHWRLGRRSWAALSLLLPLIVTTFSTSQSAVACLLGLLVLLGLGVLSWRTATALVAAGIVAGFTLCGPAAHWMKQAGLGQADWMPLSFRHRVLTWDFVAGHLGDHPWIGYGLEGSRAVPGGDGHFTLPMVGDVPVLPVHPHNLFMQVRLELGWVGAVLASLLLLAILHRLTRLNAGIRPLAIALFGTTIFTQCFAYGAWQAWLIGGMLFASAMVALAGRITAPS